MPKRRTVVAASLTIWTVNEKWALSETVGSRVKFGEFRGIFRS
jgi:hypothetical protein